MPVGGGVVPVWQVGHTLIDSCWRTLDESGTLDTCGPSPFVTLIMENPWKYSNRPITPQVLLWSAFKPSSGINQDYLNHKYIWSWLKVKNTVSTEQILYHIRLRDVVDAGHFDGHGHVHRWTCVGGGGGRGENTDLACPSLPVSKYKDSTCSSRPHSITHVPPLPKPHPPTSETLLQRMEIKHAKWHWVQHTHISTQQFAIWFTWSVCLWSDARGQKLQGSTVVQSTGAI